VVYLKPKQLIIKDCAQRFVLKLYRHEASRGFFAIAELLVFCRRWSDLDKISETGAEWHGDCGDVVEIETRCRIPIWRESQNHLPHCRVLPLGEFNVMIPELREILQGAATGRILWHVIPETRIILHGAATWWILSRFQSHIAGCSHLAKSMLWSCHVAGCKNCIRHIENRFLQYFFLFLMQFRLWRAAAFVSSPINLSSQVKSSQVAFNKQVTIAPVLKK